MTEVREHREQLKKGLHKIPILSVFPGMSPGIITTSAEDAKALVLIGHANGAIQHELHPTISKLVDEGKVVVILSDNPGAGHGVLRYSDRPQVDVVKAGATHLEKPNITNLEEVVEAINEDLDSGLEGEKLVAKLKDRFNYKPDEKKPVSELDGGVFPPKK